MKPNRREFALLGAGTVLGAMAAPSALGSLMIDASDPKTDVPWYHRIKRTGQTNFNEKDPVNANVEEWANYWASAKVDAVALSVSGPVAFYPTDVPYYRRSPFLNGRDLFGDCVKAAKARGIRVYGRMSPDILVTDPKLLAANPLWFRRDREGNLQSPAPDIAYTCQFSGNFSELQPAILHELNDRYDIDGVYMNGWPTEQSCYCDNCKKIGEPRTAKYREALLTSAIELIETYKKVVTAKKPHNFYSCNLGGGLKGGGMDQLKLTRGALWYTADNQARSGVVAPVWQDAQQVKFARCLMGERPVAAVTASYSRSGNISWRNVTGDPAEAECRMAQTSAAGGIIWYHWLGLEQGFHEDRRWQKMGREFLSWHAKHDAHWQNVRSMAKVAILATPKATAMYQAPTTEDKEDAIEGFYAVLVEARIPFDFVHDELLTDASLSQYSALILPNVALLSDARCAVLERFVERGGSMLATFETGLYDETGKAREDFALGKMFGISKAGEREKAGAVSAQSLTSVNLQKVWQRNAITAGFEDTEWIAGPIWRVPLKPVEKPVMTFINPYPTYPTEAVYQREPPTNLPSIVLREIGKSRLAYLAGDIDASHWRLDNWDLGRVLFNTIQWVLGENNSVSVTGEGLMDVHAWETEPGFAIHMVNYNGANAFRGKMRKPITLGAQSVRIVLPRDVTIKKASLLRAEKPLVFHQRGRVVEFTVPAVGSYEVAALEV